MTEKTEVSKLLQEKLQAAVLAGRVRGMRLHKQQIAARVGTHYAVTLDAIAEALGESRTALATSLLEAAIVDAARAFSIPEMNSEEWYKGFGERLRKLHGEQLPEIDAEEVEQEGEEA